MGITYVDVKVRKYRDSTESRTIQFLVDSGAIYSVIPEEQLAEIGVEPVESEDFTLADGRKVTRSVGDAYFELEGRGGYAKVIFGQEGDSSLLGAPTLEALGMFLDPIRRELRPLPMLLV